MGIDLPLPLIISNFLAHAEIICEVHPKKILLPVEILEWELEIGQSR